MAAVLRTAAAVSLLLALASPSRLFHSAAVRLPFPITCYERCPISDADCLDTCRRHEIQQQIIESETGGGEGEFPSKRASAFVRIGRPARSFDNKRTSSFIRIGKKQQVRQKRTCFMAVIDGVFCLPERT